MFLTSSQILAYLAIQEKGNWTNIYQRLVNKEVNFESDVIDTLSKNHYRFITILDEEYPACLRNVYQPPFVLFYDGNISLLKDCFVDNQVAIIGSRECSEYGIQMTQDLTREIAQEFTVVSGLAKGIDAIASQTAMEAGGHTIAVLGCGIDICYPEENLPLFNKIKDDDLLISEYPEGVPPSPDKFPMRNRIIAGLGKGILVTEAGYRSGTSITVGFGLQNSRVIMCVPALAGQG